MQMKIVIIGAGFAGASCAWWLVKLGAKDVTVLEQEDAPGMHSSGLNAGFAREFEEDEAVAPLAKEGVSFIRNPPKGFVKQQVIECNGSLLLFTKNAALKENIITKAAAVQKVPVLSSAEFEKALWTPTDGIVDIHEYLWAFINGAKAGGAKFLMNQKIKKFHVSGSKPNVESFETDKGVFECDVLVNAAGAWVQEMADMCGAEGLKIKPYRRHLYQTTLMKDVDPKWPMVWDIEKQYYFRPESGGLLLGACDEDEMKPCSPITDPKICELLAEKLSKFCPLIANVSIMREWCGMRTFTPDKRPVVRWDKKVGNFYWIAALGGRGMTCAAPVGRIAAEDIIKGIKA